MKYRATIYNITEEKVAVDAHCINDAGEHCATIADSFHRETCTEELTTIAQTMLANIGCPDPDLAEIEDMR